MEIVSEGSLETISRPSSTSSEKRCCRANQIKHKHTLLPSGSLEILPPEGQGYRTSFSPDSPDQIISLVEEDIAVEDLLGESKSCDLSECGNEEDEAAIPGNGEENSKGFNRLPQCTPCSGSEDSEEPGQQLATQETGSTSEEEEVDDEEELDPKIKKGLEKIRKLDKILADKTKKEKEVKMYRRQLERMWQERIKQLELEREQSGQGKPVELGPAHLLALGPPDGSSDETGAEDSRSVTPVFATQPTQPLGSNESRHIDSSQDAYRDDSSPCSKSSSSAYDDGDSRSSPSGKEGRKGTRRDKKAKDSRTNKVHPDKKGKQDFIKRNKKLAADAGNIIPMTEEEKKRIEELMSEDTDQLMLDTPFIDTLSLAPGTGYQPEEDEQKALADIDMKLQALLPSDELELLSNRELVSSFSQESTITLNTLLGDEGAESENNDIGERVLREEKHIRDMRQRLQAIEDQLRTFDSLPVDDTQARLSDELLAKLLAGSRTTSRSTTISETVWSALSTPTPLVGNVHMRGMNDGLEINGVDSRSSSR